MLQKLPLVLASVLLLPTALLAQTLTIVDHARHLYDEGSYQESAAAYVEAIQHGDRTPDAAETRPARSPWREMQSRRSPI